MAEDTIIGFEPDEGNCGLSTQGRSSLPQAQLDEVDSGFVLRPLDSGRGSNQQFSDVPNEADPSPEPTEFGRDGQPLIDKPTTTSDPDIVLHEDVDVACFMTGTRIATPQGEVAVETLQINDLVTTEDGCAVPVKWVGRHSVSKALVGARTAPVRLQAGALGHRLPHTDLIVTADHGMIVGGLVILASALVNSNTIDWVPREDLPEFVTYYHVETENHDVILANGAPAETFIDYAGRRAFDNFEEYSDLYGAERIIREMDRPRISAKRLVPGAIKARLGIADEFFDFDQCLSA